MSNIAHSPARILVVDSAAHSSLLWTTLEEQHGIAVSHLSAGHKLLESLRKVNPDLIVLSTNLTDPPAASLLAQLKAQDLTVPIVLTETNGKLTDADFDYEHIIGWLSHPYSVSELVTFIRTALERSWPAGDLVLAKRTELIESYRQLAQYTRDLEMVNEVSRLVSSTLEVEEIPRLLVKHITKILGAECGSLALIDQERNSVVFQLAHDSEGNELKGLKDFLMPMGAGLVGKVAQTGLPQMTNDAPNHPDWSPLADELTGFKTKKIIAAPLVTEGEILGVVEVLNKAEGDFTERDLQLLSLVASSAAIAIQNARQYEAIKQANETLQQFQQQRIASERWAVLGKATGNLAHRINNTTAVVPLAAQRLHELLQPIPLPSQLRQEVEANLDRIQRNTLYTVELASSLMRRFRPNPTSAYDINEMVERALAVVEIPNNIKVMCHLDPNLPPAETTELLIDAVVELITNAVKAMMPAGGMMRIATFKTSKDKISIQVTDNGPGIARDKLDKVFDMFYTTSPHGLGFGLWWVKTFLEQQNGDITVESRPNQGATFTITLPRHLSSLQSSEK